MKWFAGPKNAFQSTCLDALSAACGDHMSISQKILWYSKIWKHNPTHYLYFISSVLFWVNKQVRYETIASFKAIVYTMPISFAFLACVMLFTSFVHLSYNGVQEEWTGEPLPNFIASFVTHYLYHQPKTPLNYTYMKFLRPPLFFFFFFGGGGMFFWDKINNFGNWGI